MKDGDRANAFDYIQPFEHCISFDTVDDESGNKILVRAFVMIQIYFATFSVELYKMDFDLDFLLKLYASNIDCQ